MGYSTTFRLKGEIDKQFQYNRLKENNTEKNKTILNAVCLHNYKIRENDFCMYIDLSNIYDTIKSVLQLLINDYSNQAKKRFVLDSDNEIDFYGWNFSDSSMAPAFESLDTLSQYYLNELFELAIIPTQSKFEKDTNYYDKAREISDSINSIEQEVDDLMNHLFVVYYREHPELADEDDGINHFFPEKKKSETNLNNE